MQLQGCVNKVFCWLPWPSGIVTVGVGIWWSGVEGFTSCIVYWYIVQFFNTFYLQQYLCIFYEVIKLITLHTSVFADSWFIYFFSFDKTVEFCQNMLGVTSRVKGEVRMRAAESLAAAAAAVGASPTAVCDVAEITVSCSSPLEMARYTSFLFPPRANVKLG